MFEEHLITQITKEEITQINLGMITHALNTIADKKILRLEDLILQSAIFESYNRFNAGQVRGKKERFFFR